MPSADRQAERDKEYRDACKLHGIDPEIPRYEHFRGAGPDKDFDLQITRYATPLDEPSDGDEFQFFDDEPEADEIPKEFREAFSRMLKFLFFGSRDSATACCTAGLRVIALGWLLGTGPSAGRPLAAIASELGCTRALLSHYVRQVEDATGLHARRQKSKLAVGVYREARLRSIESGRGVGL